MNSFDPRAFRSAMGQFATGVTVITFDAGGTPAGMTANAFMSVSLEPPLVLISVRRSSRFNEYVREGGHYGVNFLASDQQHISNHCGGRPVEGLDMPYIDGHAAPLLSGSLAQLVARVVAVHEAGDHLLYVGHVEHLGTGEAREPLLFHAGQYKQLPVALAA